MADPDPKNEAGDVEPPESGAVFADNTNAFVDLIGPGHKRKQRDAPKKCDCGAVLPTSAEQRGEKVAVDLGIGKM